MEFDIKTMNMRANALIKETKPNPVIATLILMIFAYAITGVSGYAFVLLAGEFSDKVPTAAIVIFIILSVLKVFLDVGYSWYTLSISREETPALSEMFKPFTNIPIKCFFVVIIKNIIIAVFFILLFIPAVIAFYWFRPLYFIAKDHPEMSVFKMLSASIKMMKGNKMTWFKIDISFIIFHIINYVTYGLFSIYSLQRISTVYAEYYDFIKAQSNISE